jgi:hypothetical protein
VKWSVSDSVRQRKTNYRSSRGKYKSKTKLARKSDVQVALTVRGKQYEIASGEKKETLHARRQVKLSGDVPLNPRVLIDAVAELYGSVNPTGGK